MTDIPFLIHKLRNAPQLVGTFGRGDPDPLDEYRPGMTGEERDWLIELAVAALQASTVSTESEYTRNLANALRMQEAAEESHANCDECYGEDDPVTCSKCFPLFDEARVERRRLLSALNVPQTAPSDALSQLEQQFLRVLDGWEENSSSPAAVSALQYALGAVRDAAHRSSSQAENPSPEPGDCPFDECQHPEECKPICAFAPCRKQRLSKLTQPQAECADRLESLIHEYARDLRRNSSGGDDYPWEWAKGTADYLDVLIERSRQEPQS